MGDALRSEDSASRLNEVEPKRSARGDALRSEDSASRLNEVEPKTRSAPRTPRRG